MHAGVGDVPINDDDTAETVPAPITRRVTVSDIGDLRRLVNETAAAIGMDRAQAFRFTVAVNEVVINAVQHGGGTAEVTVSGTREDDGGKAIVVIVVDRGPGWNGNVPADLPSSDAVHGRGLWMAHRLCADVTIRTSVEGTMVRLREPVGRHESEDIPRSA
jgi:serine/threonine-protein kinase RsbW